MIRELNETKIPQFYSTGLYSEAGYDLAQEHTNKILSVLVEGTTTCLADIKSKDFPVAFVFEEANKTFIAAAIVEFLALGCGLIIIPFLVFKEIKVLKIAVEVGFVVGITAATKPIGSAIFLIP